jgi:hypothetical protein
VWSVLSKPIDIYLHSKGAMVRASDHTTMVNSHPITLPFDRVLDRLVDDFRVHAKFPEHVLPFKSSKLRITLGGSLCQALVVVPPAGLQTGQELEQLIQAQAAQHLGMPAQGIVCSYSTSALSVTASVLPTAWLDSLRAWALRNAASLSSVQPLWALATHSALARAPTVRALYVQEADCITMLSTTNSQRYLHAANNMPTESTAQWIASQGLSNTDILRYTFGRQSNMPIKNTPAIWREYWSINA